MGGDETMGNGPSPDSKVLVEVLDDACEDVPLARLGPEFLEAQGIPVAMWDRPFRVEIDGRVSKAGNVYFEFQQAAVPLPSGLDTRFAFEGRLLEWHPVEPSRAGHPTRRHSGVVQLSGMPYAVTAYVTEGKQPFWIKVVAYKGTRVRAPLTHLPEGGRLV